MLLNIVLAALRLQGMGPVLPPQCSPAFQATVHSIEQALDAGDFDQASARLRLLPKRTVAVQWVDDKVPAQYRDSMKRAADAAIAMWSSRLPVKFEWKQAGDIRISFEPVLALRPGTNLPAGHVGFWSEDPAQPRLDFVIGVKRGAPLQQSEETDVFNDVAYAVGTYCGVADGVYDTSVMTASDLPHVVRGGVSGTEFNAAVQNMNVVDTLIQAVKDRVRLNPAQPDMYLDPVSIKSDPTVQGAHVEFHTQVTNRGAGILSLRIIPDCGCTVASDPGLIGPQASRLLKFVVDTSNFISDVDKYVAIYANDPKEPVRMVTLHVRITARYRILTPLGNTVVVPDRGLDYPLFLIPAKGTTLDPISATFTGSITGKVTFSHWQGVLPDADMKEGPKLRKGFKFVIHMNPNLPIGRNQSTLQIYTSNADFPDISWSVNAQKGIIALPPEVVMGAVSKVPKTVSFLITRPGPPFKIVGVASNCANIAAAAEPSKDQTTYSVVVHYDGKARPGELLAELKVRTTDAKQPVLFVPIHAYVQ